MADFTWDPGENTKAGLSSTRSISDRNKFHEHFARNLDDQMIKGIIRTLAVLEVWVGKNFSVRWI